MKNQATGIHNVGEAIVSNIRTTVPELAMEPLESNKTQQVTVAFRAILQRMQKPQTLSIDQDQAFGGPFNKMLDEKNTVHRLKRGMDSIAV